MTKEMKFQKKNMKQHVTLHKQNTSIYTKKQSIKKKNIVNGQNGLMTQNTIQITITLTGENMNLVGTKKQEQKQIQ